MTDEDYQQPGDPDHLDGASVRDGASSQHRPRATNYDDELRLLDEVLRGACRIQRHEHVLDIGCGTGQTTRDAGRMAPAGSALGVDISASAIERASELARVERLPNVTFNQGDAQVHHFLSGHFDLAFSRFGTMFFDDPIAAFANIGRALRPAGRLMMMVWQRHEVNEWSVSIERALRGREGAALAPEASGTFSLADQTTVEGILDAAGFTNVTFSDVREPVYYGGDITAALAWVCGFASTSDALKRLDQASAARALERLREMLSTRAREDGVWFDSRAWIVAARH
ncbi:MAG: class I SAM-dependent methyltransferase [Actinomycetota bacterium]